MTMLDTLEGILDQTHTPYTHTKHRAAYTAREVAQADHIPAHRVAKTVVVHDRNGYGLAVVPGNAYVDLSQLRALLGSSQLRLATETEIARLFPDCEVGAMPPFGNLRGLPVYADRSLAAEETIVFSAGTHEDDIQMRFEDFRRLVNPTLLSFAWEKGDRGMRLYDW